MQSESEIAGLIVLVKGSLPLYGIGDFSVLSHWFRFRAFEIKYGELSEDHVVCFRKDDLKKAVLSIVASFASNHPETGKISFDLEAIQRTIGHQFLRFKPTISAQV